MASQRKFVIALWTILSVGALAMFARPQGGPQHPDAQPDAQLANAHVDSVAAAQR